MNKIIIKNPEQIAGIKHSSQLARKTLQYIRQYVNEGVNTHYLDKKIDEYIRDNNAIPATLNYRGFPKSCCTSINEIVCHGIPSEKDILTNGDILNIDVTTILDGYFGDTSTMFTIGEISKEAHYLIDATRHCLDLGIQQVHPNNKFGNIGYSIARYAQSKGLNVVSEFTGHGVGLKFHEAPHVTHIAQKNSGKTMTEGMIFTIEPMINLGTPKIKIDKKDKWTVRTADRRLSAQFEHTVLVTPKGYEVLSDIDNEYGK